MSSAKIKKAGELHLTTADALGKFVFTVFPFAKVDFF